MSALPQILQLMQHTNDNIKLSNQDHYKATPSDTLVSGPLPASDFILGFYLINSTTHAQNGPCGTK